MAERLPPIRFAVPGALGQRTGGYGYDRRIVAELRAAGHRVDVVELDGSFPLCDETARAAAAHTVKSLSPGALLIIDGLALPAFTETCLNTATAVALIHHPLSLEPGLSASERSDLEAMERTNLSRATGIITTSSATAEMLEKFGIAPGMVEIVLPGTEAASKAVGSGGGAVALLCVGALVPRKGHGLLIDALADCAALPWRLNCIGSLDRDPRTAADVAARIARQGLQDRVDLRGEVADAALAAAYNAADVFVLASALEGYGMAFAEALAHGLPIVGSGDGAVCETVPETAGLIVPVGDRAALREALARAIGDDALRARLARGARQAGAGLPDWPTAGRAFARALARFAGAPA